MSPEARARWAGIALSVWACGALLFETLALIGVGGCLVLWAMSWRTQRPDLREAARRWWPIWAFVAWALVSSLLAGPPRGTGIARTLDWLALPLAAWAFAQTEGGARRRLATAAFALVVLSSLAAALQHFGLWPAPETFDPVRWTRIPFHRVYEPAPVEGRFMGGGLSFHRLKFSHVGGLTALFALGLALRAQGRDRALALGATVVAMGSIALFTYARAATAALLASTALVLLLQARGWRRALLTLGALGVAGGLVLAASPGLRARFGAALTSSGSGDRDAILATGLRAFRTRPLVGVGVGGFTPARYADAQTPRHVRENPGKAHNQLFSVAIETGLIGAALFVLMLGWLARGYVRSRSTLGIAALVYFVLLGLAHDPLFQAEFSLALVLALGLAVAGKEGNRDGAPA